MLPHLNICSQKGPGVERFDSSIGASSVTMPYGGKYPADPDAGHGGRPSPCSTGAAPTPASVMALGYRPRTCMSAGPLPRRPVLRSSSRLPRWWRRAATFSTAWLTFQEYFERLERRSQPLGQAACGAARQHARPSWSWALRCDRRQGLACPVPSSDIDVPPTLVSFAICPRTTPDKVISPEFKLRRLPGLLSDAADMSTRRLARLSAPSEARWNEVRND